MENDIIERAEQLGHEAEGLRYFTYDRVRPKTPIVEGKLGKFERVVHYGPKTKGETTYLIFKGVISPCEYGQGLTFIEKLLSGEVFKQDTRYVCRDREKLVARIEAEQKEELRRQLLETIADLDWEGRTWQFACDMYIRRRGDVFEGSLMKAAINEAKLFVEQYKKSMEGDL